MASDTFSQETQERFKDSHLWKPWMKERRLFQATSLSHFRKFLESGSQYKRISLDFETEDLSRTPESVCGFCLAFTDREGIYVPIKHVNYPSMNLDPDETWNMVLSAIKDRLVAVYNWEFEGTILKRLGIERGTSLNELNDAMVYRWLFDSDKKQFNLKDAALDLIGCEMLNIHEVPEIQIGKRSKQINFALSSPEEACLYAAADPIFTLAVLDHCKPTVDKEQNFIAVLEHRILGTLSHMRDNRMTIDRAFLQQARIDLNRWIDHVARMLYKKAGEEFDINSNKEVTRILKQLGIQLKRTKNEKQENYETNAKALEPLAKDHPIVDDLLFYRSLAKERSTYIDALLNCTSEELPTVIFKLVSIGAATGRFSSGGVDEGDSLYAPMNIQNIVSSSGYRKAKVRRVVIQGLQLRS